MDKVQSFIKECGYFFLATAEDNQPHVRVMDVMGIYENKLYFYVDDHKLSFKQMLKNPKIEVCGINDKLKQIRVIGHANLDEKDESIMYFKNKYPDLAKRYSSTSGPLIKLFFLTEVHAYLQECDDTREILI